MDLASRLPFGWAYLISGCERALICCLGTGGGSWSIFADGLEGEVHGRSGSAFCDEQLLGFRFSGDADRNRMLLNGLKLLVRLR